MIRVWAPSNIALVKYMGKSDARANLPANASLSMTLASLRTELELRPGAGPGFSWSPEPPAGHGSVPRLSADEAERFTRHALRTWEASPALLQRFGLEARGGEPSFEIRAANTFPKGAGIASSASSFAALTLAVTAARCASIEGFRDFWSTQPRLRQSLASLSRQGSGSSCRSLEGPWVVWKGAEARAVGSRMPELADLVVVIQAAPKPVSSSEAHSRILQSPLWEGRVARANARAEELERAIASGAIERVAAIAWEEAWEMHSLFHTSRPPFTYWEPGTVEFLRWISPEAVGGGGSSPIVTLDAGANVHVLVPVTDATSWKRRISERFPDFPILEDRQGAGAELA